MDKKIESLTTEKSKDTLRLLISGLIDYHPLPWAYEHDWTAELVDANKQTIIKTRTPEEAKEIAFIANSFQTKEISDEEIENLLR